MNIAIDQITINEIKTQLNTLAQNLLDALEGSDREKILADQKMFTDTISTMWNIFEQSETDPKIKSIPRLVMGWAIKELPEQIKDPNNDAQIKHELKLFQRSLIMFDFKA